MAMDSKDLARIVEPEYSFEPVLGKTANVSDSRLWPLSKSFSPRATAARVDNELSSVHIFYFHYPDPVYDDWQLLKRIFKHLPRLLYETFPKT